TEGIGAALGAGGRQYLSEELDPPCAGGHPRFHPGTRALPGDVSAGVMKPYSEACQRNRAPILSVLRRCFTQPGVVLEIGAGTGQHAVYFAEHLPHLDWHPTDREEH